MSEVVLSRSTCPKNVIQGAPRMIVYDPGEYVLNRQQLRPFESIAKVYHCKELFLQQIENAQDQQIFLLMIFSRENDTDVRHFLLKYIRDQAHLHSLYLIFHNGLKSHDQYINTQSMPKLRWCRSFTCKLFQDIRDACQTACDASIAYFKQQMIIAQDGLNEDSADTANSIVSQCAVEKKKLSLLLGQYLLEHL